MMQKGQYLRTVLRVSLAALACSPSPPPRQRSEGAAAYDAFRARVDSVALERTSCFGTCPAYRLLLSSSGAVHFESRNARESGRTADDTLSNQDVSRVLGAVFDAGLLALPDKISESPLCGLSGTDSPTATIHLYLKDTVKVVEDYHGCQSTPAGLRALQTLIDQVTGSHRWIRPNQP